MAGEKFFGCKKTSWNEECIYILGDASYENSADMCDQKSDKLKTETGFVNTACSTSIQPVNLAQEEQPTRL